jgi:hypothetical protein
MDWSLQVRLYSRHLTLSHFTFINKIKQIQSVSDEKILNTKKALKNDLKNAEGR